MQPSPTAETRRPPLPRLRSIMTLSFRGHRDQNEWESTGRRSCGRSVASLHRLEQPSLNLQRVESFETESGGSPPGLPNSAAAWVSGLLISRLSILNSYFLFFIFNFVILHLSSAILHFPD